MSRFWAWIKRIVGYPPVFDEEPEAEPEEDLGAKYIKSARKPEVLPTVDEVLAAAYRLNTKPWCHDNRCRGRAKHECHDLSCKEHQG